jgi:hypothetical protein
LDEPVSEGGFAMVDMGDDGEIADFGEICHDQAYDLESCLGQARVYAAVQLFGENNSQRQISAW